VKPHDGALPTSSPRRLKLADERGSTIPLMLVFFVVAGMMLTGGVVASSAFLQLRSLQSACDGAAIAAANGFERGGGELGDNLPFDAASAEAAVQAYAAAAWQADASAVALDVNVDGDQVVVVCSRTAHVPFEAVFAPNGIDQSVAAVARAPLDG
jgi:hypothetical protein